MKNVVRLSSEELARLDLLRFNGGVSPYPENDTTIASAFTRRNADYYREYIEKTKFMNGGTVLDLGCGIGNWSLFLAECNEHVVGIDRNAGCVNLARNMASDLGLKNLEFLCADLTNLTMQLPNGQFDYVWLWSVLQYVERGAAMREIFRLLKKGGKLFVGMYNSTGLMLEHIVNGLKKGSLDPTGLWAIRGLENGPLGDGNPSYGDLASIEKLCDRYGFRLIQAAPSDCLDLRMPDGINHGVEAEMRFDEFVRTVEFIAEKC